MNNSVNTPVRPSTVSTEASRDNLISVAPKPLYSFFKRLFDIIISFIALCILIVPMLIIALIVFIDSPEASPIFTQKRVGKNGKVFKFHKFRSMIPGAEDMIDELIDRNEMDGPAFKIKDDPRITRVGRFLRSSSLDELPQLFNVLSGKMSLVGPRPPLPREVEEYTNYQMQRLCVTPGITCYWQIQPKRNDLTFDEWLELDIKYIKERSLTTDVKIIIKTFGAVFGMEGV